ncbi:helix-turn-helix domain-containing protein [Haloglomus halophilum]|uniref:helix-turn-helix domain-containing protein n=1 Tax=Haloglomus halophilum TaxID=2962672 RepID=UPI0020C9B99E|nr:helix-turn-helix domain-containing protein [Haloglomus halophilum]
MSPSDESGRSRLFAVVVTAWLLFGAVAGVPLAAASDATATPLGDDGGGLLNETLDSTTDTVDGTVDGTASTVETTVDSTTDVVDETTDSTTSAVDGTVESTGETLDTATGGATDDTTDAVTVATDGVTDATDTTTGEVTETVGVTASTVNATADDTTNVVSSTTDGDLEGATGSLTDATGEVTDLTTDRVTSLAETTETLTSDLSAGTTGAVAELTGDGTLVSTEGTTGGLTDATTGEALSTGADSGLSSSERVARLDDGSGDLGGAAAEDGSSDGADGAPATPPDGERSLAAGSGSPTAFGGWEHLPVSEEEATGLGLGALLVGGAGVAVRQASMTGGTGAGTTAARASTSALAAGDGPLSRLARMLSLFRYSRYDDSDPLELDARRHVYEAISDQPGEPITAVSDRADVNLSTARHHVKVLEREGLVATGRVRNCERFYPAGTDDLELAAAMADECTADILDALVRLEPASVSGLAEAVDRSPSTVTHHLQKLEDDDIVVRERNGRSVENKLSAAARAALDPETERRRHAAERKLEADRADAASGASAD